MTSRFQFPTNSRDTVVWKWLPTEGHWLLIHSTLTDKELNLAETSPWIPPGDGGDQQEFWAIVRKHA